MIFDEVDSGVGGGVVLARPPQEISLFELCEALDDPVLGEPTELLELVDRREVDRPEAIDATAQEDARPTAVAVVQLQDLAITPGALRYVERALASAERPGANERIGIGYIGVGRRGNQLMGLPADAQIVAVADVVGFAVVVGLVSSSAA